jgi:hypothetical protein
MADADSVRRAADGLLHSLRADELADRVRRTAESLRAAAEAQGMHVTADDRIGECDLARLLGVAAGTMANRRREGRGPPHFSLPFARHRVTYRVEDVAAWIERSRESG